jgi:hypothetical protein
MPSVLWKLNDKAEKPGPGLGKAVKILGNAGFCPVRGSN